MIIFTITHLIPIAAWEKMSLILGHKYVAQGENRGKERSASQSSQRLSYASSFQIIQLGNKRLVNLKIDEASFSAPTINLGDIPVDSPLYGQLQAYLQTKEQGDTYASLIKEGDTQKCPLKKLYFVQKTLIFREVMNLGRYSKGI